MSCILLASWTSSRNILHSILHLCPYFIVVISEFENNPFIVNCKLNSCKTLTLLSGWLNCYKCKFTFPTNCYKYKVTVPTLKHYIFASLFTKLQQSVWFFTKDESKYICRVLKLNSSQAQQLIERVHLIKMNEKGMI